MNSEYDELAPGTAVDRFVVEKTLGQGGMAVVYRVAHRKLGTRHALKVLTLPMKSVERRLLQEGRLQATLRHDNLVAVTDIIDVEGAPGLVMEYIDGPSLDHLLANTRLTIEQADALARGILAGVAHVHAAGLVHRDLKPANVMVEVTDDGLVPKVADFGLAKILDQQSGPSRTRSGTHFGTPAYMSPEQIRDTKAVDVRADVFSLGAILYELVCGERCFDEADVLATFNRIAEGRYVPPEDKVPGLPERMAAAIHGALEPDREQRIATCEELLAIWTGDSEIPAAQRLGPWDTETLQRAEVLGSGGEGFVVPAETRGETWSGSSLDLFSSEAPATASTPPPAGRSLAMVVASAILALAIAGGAAMVSLSVLGVGALSLVETPPPPALPESARVPAAPVAPVAAPDPPPEPVAPVKRKRGARRRSVRVAPVPAPALAPAPTEEEPPMPEPAAPTGPPPGKARVVVKGNVSRVVLRAPSGNVGPGDIEPGTYLISAFFDGAKPVDSGRITVAAGEVRTLTCDRMLRSCR